MATLKDKNVLVTGGAGFIGSHLCDAIMKESVAKLISVDNLFLGKESNLDKAKKFDNFIFERFDITNFNEKYLYRHIFGIVLIIIVIWMISFSNFVLDYLILLQLAFINFY